MTQEIKTDAELFRAFLSSQPASVNTAEIEPFAYFQAGRRSAESGAAVRGEAVAAPQEFIDAVNGARGDLDAWLEVNNEADCRAIFKALLAPRAADAPSEPSDENDLLEIARTLCSIAARRRELTDSQRANYPHVDEEGSPVLDAARAACLARGYTEDGLSVEGVAYPRAADALDSQPTELHTALLIAAKAFYNATVADPEVRLSAASEEKRDIAARAADQLRAVIELAKSDSRAPAAQAASVALDAGPFTLAQRMPPKNIEVLVYAKIGKSPARWWIDEWYDEDGESGWGNGVGDDETIHWQPLPPAPQQEGSEAGNG